MYINIFKDKIFHNEINSQMYILASQEVNKYNWLCCTKSDFSLNFNIRGLKTAIKTVFRFNKPLHFFVFEGNSQWIFCSQNTILYNR